MASDSHHSEVVLVETLKEGNHHVVELDVEVEDVGSEASQSDFGAGVATGTGSPEELVFRENESALASRDRSVLSGGSRRGTGSSAGTSRVCIVEPHEENRWVRDTPGSGSHTSERTNRSSELRLHLNKKEQEEAEKKMAEKRKREEEVSRVRRKMEEERRKKGVEILPGSRESRGVIQAFLSEEEVLALNVKQQELDEESEQIRAGIKQKYGIDSKKKQHSDTGLVSMAAEFYSSKEMPNEILPERIRRNLTTDEIRDLKLVFDMFDAKGRG